MNRLLLCLAVALTASPLASAAEPNWIWSTKDAATKAPAGSVYFRRGFDVEAPQSATLEITADNRYEVFLNGRNVGAGESWQTRTRYDLSPLLIPGRNVVAVLATNDGEDPAGLVAKLVVQQKDKKPTIEIVSDGEWKFTNRPLGNWARLEFDDRSWTNAQVLGPYGAIAPWGKAGEVIAPRTMVTASKPRVTEKGFFEFRNNDRVVFLGGAFIERMQKHGYLEAMITAGLPDKNLTFRNLGWSGDTVWGDARGVFGGRAEGFKRLMNDVNLCQPTVIVVCYGENEAYAGPEGVEEFRGGLNKLLDNLEGTGARLLLLSPRRHETLGYPLPDASEYNKSLMLYRDVLKETAAQREHAFLDLYHTLPLPSGDSPKAITDNGIHLNPWGECLLANELLPQLGVPKRDWSISLDLKRNTLDAVGVQVSEVKTDDKGVSFTAVSRGFELPFFDSITERRLNVQGLPGTGYHLFIDGEPHQSPNSWNSPFALQLGSKRAAELQKKINEKNELFFNRYRPQNETYLFLFRKHEQGNNAVEIPQFDPLIEAKEKEIAELKKPVTRKFEVKLAP
jgi:lysophospholipase L1-like esterase